MVPQQNKFTYMLLAEDRLYFLESTDLVEQALPIITAECIDKEMFCRQTKSYLHIFFRDI